MHVLPIQCFIMMSLSCVINHLLRSSCAVNNSCTCPHNHAVKGLSIETCDKDSPSAFEPLCGPLGKGCKTLCRLLLFISVQLLAYWLNMDATPELYIKSVFVLFSDDRVGEQRGPVTK